MRRIHHAARGDGQCGKSNPEKAWKFRKRRLRLALRGDIGGRGQEIRVVEAEQDCAEFHRRIDLGLPRTPSRRDLFSEAVNLKAFLISRPTSRASTPTIFNFALLSRSLPNIAARICNVRPRSCVWLWIGCAGSRGQLGSRYVFLNQPAFEVSYFNGACAPLTMRAVVGKRNAQTYFFTERIKEIT